MYKQSNLTFQVLDGVYWLSILRYKHISWNVKFSQGLFLTKIIIIIIIIIWISIFNKSYRVNWPRIKCHKRTGNRKDATVHVSVSQLVLGMDFRGSMMEDWGFENVHDSSGVLHMLLALQSTLPWEYISSKLMANKMPFFLCLTVLSGYYYPFSLSLSLSFSLSTSNHKDIIPR